MRPQELGLVYEEHRRVLIASMVNKRSIPGIESLSMEESLAAMECSPYFDADWYRSNNLDVRNSGIRPAEHYLLFGAAEGRAPSPRFGTNWYMLAYPDVAKGISVNPLLHFIFLGEDAGRLPLAPGLVSVASVDDILQLVRDSGLFDETWYARVSPDLAGTGIGPIMHYLRWGATEGRNPSPRFHTSWYARNASVGLTGLNPLLHYILFGRAEGLECIEPTRADAADIDIVRASAFFDAQYYLDNNPDVEKGGLDPYAHFCEFGYKELRNPSPAFDLLWYQQSYLRGDAVGAINPVVHYETRGRTEGCLPKSPRTDFRQVDKGVKYAARARTKLRRACLFAGYDPQGMVDDYVVSYIKELSRFADVFYLADCEMQEGELEKLAPYVRGAWAERHGMYDFGSYSKVAATLVGWDALDSYDELLLVNDSCYCLGKLDPVFARMDVRQCDWWGLQATKGTWSTRAAPANAFKEPIPIDEVKARHLADFEADYTYDFLIGSYFLVFRKPVLSDQVFRELLQGVRKEQSKRLIIEKYEVGFTRFLIHAGYAFDTFVEHLHPFHPVYSLTHFELIRQGFPLLKRFLLTENHYQAPGLHRWQQMLAEARPGVDTRPIVGNLDRVGDQEKLYRNLNIQIGDDGQPHAPAPLSNEAFIEADAREPKHDNWWVFPVCAFNHTLGGNERAVFEAVRNDPDIKKIILYRSRKIELDGANIEYAPLRSLEGQHFLARARIIFVKHTPTSNLVYPVSGASHHIINLWHGIPLKRIGYASLDQQKNLDRLFEEHRRCRAVIASSKVDRLAMASAFYPLSYRDVWVTGLPRNDFIVRAFGALPRDFQEEEQRLERALKGRRLVLFAPTFRNAQRDAYYQFSARELARLTSTLKKHNAVLGVREHLADTAHSYTEQFHGLGALPLGDHLYPNIEVLYRQASALLTDYSSCFFDFSLTGRPMVSFAYDLQHYQEKERGFFYELADVFPGPVCGTFDEMLAALSKALGKSTPADHNYEQCRRTFFDYTDDGSAARLVQHVKALLAGETPN